MLAIILGLWNGWRGSTYQAQHVNVAARMIRANLTLPHVIVCSTDMPAGIDYNAVDHVVPLWPRWPGLETWRGRPNCFHRLRMYSPEWQAALLQQIGLGQDLWPSTQDCRLVSWDLDTVITANVDELFKDMEPFKVTRGYACRYNGSLQMVRPGEHTHVFDNFHPLKSPLDLLSARTSDGRRLVGSDQAWLHTQIPSAPTWDHTDGVCFFQKHDALAKVPMQQPERVWFFAGSLKPWHQAMRVRGLRLFNAWHSYDH